MINLEALEQSPAFKALHGCKTVRRAVPKLIEEFGDYAFTRSHVVSALSELPEIRKRAVDALDETVRQEIIDLARRGIIEKTGEKKFNRDLYRRAKL